MQPVVPSATDVDVTFYVLDSTTFLPYESLTAATSGLALWWRKGATGAVTAITEADHTNLTDAHSDGKIKHIDDGRYRLSLPDAAIPTAENEVTEYGGTATGYIILGGAIVGKATANATAPDNAGIAAILVDTAEIGAAGAGLTALASAANLATVDGIVDDILVDTGTTLPATLAAIVSTLSGMAAAVWAYVTRTLTQSASSVTSAVTGSNIAVYSHTTWTIALTGLGNITTRDNLWFSVHRQATDLDANAIVLIEETDGLLSLAGNVIASPIVAGDGDIDVTNATTGALTITLKPAAAALLSADNYTYTLKVRRSADDVDLISTGGRLTIVAGSPQAVS